MHITIDNLFAFLILTLILITFMGYIIPSSYLSLTTTREHQLEEVAQSVMDKMLLNPGHPGNWGDILAVNNNSQLLAFGLQKMGGTPYELDVNKILRIASVNTSSTKMLPETVRIDPGTIARLLGLGHEYGFSIRVTPALNISFRVLRDYSFKNGQWSNPVPMVVEVTVTTPEGRPAIGANATGFYILMSIRKIGNEEISYINYSYATGTVGLDGKAIFSFQPFLESIDNELGHNILMKVCSATVVYADYYGIRTSRSEPLERSSDILEGTTVGQYLMVEFPISELPKGARQMENQTGLADPPYYVYVSTLQNDTNGQSGMIINSGSKKYRVYRLPNAVDDDVSLIILPVKYLGSYTAVLFFRNPSDITCQVGYASGNIKTSVLRRMVKVGSFHYVFEVRVWRWAE
jgi:hypothetical protein